MTASERHQAMTSIFLVACDLQGEERKKALDRACPEYPGLRGELDQLLSIHDLVRQASTSKSALKELLSLARLGSE